MIDLSDDELIKGIALDLPSDDESPPQQDADQTGETARYAADAQARAALHAHTQSLPRKLEAGQAHEPGA